MLVHFGPRGIRLIFSELSSFKNCKLNFQVKISINKLLQFTLMMKDDDERWWCTGYSNHNSVFLIHVCVAYSVYCIQILLKDGGGSDRSIILWSILLRIIIRCRLLNRHYWTYATAMMMKLGQTLNTLSIPCIPSIAVCSEQCIKIKTQLSSTFSWCQFFSFHILQPMNVPCHICWMWQIGLAFQIIDAIDNANESNQLF